MKYDYEKLLIGYCGLYCRVCDYYTGYLTKAAEELLKIVEKHAEIKEIFEKSKICDYEEFIKGLRSLANLTLCLGCRAGDGWEECPVRKCALKKEVKYCIECNEYPCELINRFKSMRICSDELKAKGFEKYIKEKLGKKQTVKSI